MPLRGGRDRLGHSEWLGLLLAAGGQKACPRMPVAAPEPCMNGPLAVATVLVAVGLAISTCPAPGIAHGGWSPATLRPAYPARPASGSRRDPGAADVLSGRAHQALVAVAASTAGQHPVQDDGRGGRDQMRRRWRSARSASRACRPRQWCGPGPGPAQRPAPRTRPRDQAPAWRTRAWPPGRRRPGRPGLRRAGPGMRQRLTPRCADEFPGEKAV